MNVMDPHLRLRLAEWLAYHLSNFEYVWPWAKWAHVLDAPAYDGQRCGGLLLLLRVSVFVCGGGELGMQGMRAGGGAGAAPCQPLLPPQFDIARARRFCVAVINRLVRLSYWDRVQSVLPEEVQVLLPPKPEVAPLPTGEESDDVEGLWAAKMVSLVRSKASPEQLDAWVADNAMEAARGGGLGAARAMARCLLVAGSKSFTHMLILFERYYGPLKARMDTLGIEVGARACVRECVRQPCARGPAHEGELTHCHRSTPPAPPARQGETALVDTACTVWRRSPQRAAMAVDRLMTLRLVSATAIVRSVFGSDGVNSIEDESASGLAWEVLYNAINKCIARVQVRVAAAPCLPRGCAKVGRAHVSLPAGRLPAGRQQRRGRGGGAGGAAPGDRGRDDGGGRLGCGGRV